MNIIKGFFLFLVAIFWVACQTVETQEKKSKTIVEARHKNNVPGDVRYYPDATDTSFYIRHYFFSSGDTSAILPFVNGQANGELRCFYKTGQLERLATIKDSLYDGRCIAYYEDGSIHVYTFYKEDKRHGSYIEFYKNKVLKRRNAYNNGIEEGIYSRWDTNGIPVVSVEVRNGMETGFRLRFYSSGNLRYVAKMLENEFHGQYIEYFDNGCCMHAGQMYCGEKVGWWQVWDEGTNIADSLFQGKIPDEI